MNNISYISKAIILNIYDGDTMTVMTEIWPNLIIKSTIRLLCGDESAVDAWELRGKERELGLIARQFVVNELSNLEYVVLKVINKKEKYGRLLASVHYSEEYKDIEMICAFGKDLGIELINNGSATAFVRGMNDSEQIMMIPEKWLNDYA